MRLAKKVDSHSRSSANWQEQPSRTFDELMLNYLEETQPRKRCAARERVIARNLRGHFTGKCLNELTVADVRAYIERRAAAGLKPATINRELAVLSAAINYARREWEWELPNPVAGRKVPEPRRQGTVDNQERGTRPHPGRTG